MTTDSNIGAVIDLYTCFAQGDVEGVLAHIADDVDWSFRPAVDGAERVPMLTNLRTKAEIASVYFAGIASTTEVHSFVPGRFFADGRDVIALMSMDFTVVPTGKRVSYDEVHHFTFGTTAGSSATARSSTPPQ